MRSTAKPSFLFLLAGKRKKPGQEEPCSLTTWIWRGLASCILVAADPWGAHAAGNMICDAAAMRASRESAVPLSVLKAVTRAETGRLRGGRLSPWPWTVNMEGKGRWFGNRNEAQDYVRRNFERGARSFDVGCFQINYRWHGAAFETIEDMFDPLANARYAAAFLARLKADLGDWSKAAGAYHSRTPGHALPYRARFDRIRSALGNEPQDVIHPVDFRPDGTARSALRPAPRPLLHGTISASSRGSLVPLRQGAALPLIPLPGAGDS